MSTEPTEHVRLSFKDNVAVVDVLSRELNQPQIDREFGAQLSELVASRPADRIVLNFARTQYMSSTAFAALFALRRVAASSGVRLAICGMAPAVRFGADILCIGEYMPIYADEASALAAFGAG